MINLVRGLTADATGRPAGASMPALARAVLWSFVGVRKKRHLDADARSITPLQAIVAGLAGAAVFVLCLLGIVRLVVT